MYNSPNVSSDLNDSLQILLSEEGDMDLVLTSGSLYRAGECPPPGLYRQVDGPRVLEVKTQSDCLPASLDGHVACYRRVQSLWGQIEQREMQSAR